MSQLETTNVFGIFEGVQETFADAQQKAAQEASRQKNDYLRLNKDGVYRVRVLPLAPVLSSEGKTLPLDRKGYEYPVRNNVLTIKVTGKDGKPANAFCPVVHMVQCFPNLGQDLIDLYVARSIELNPGDSKLHETLKKNSFEGGLRWNFGHAMYVIDESDNKIKILELTHAQYKSLEDEKLKQWKRLVDRNPQHPCPISSIGLGYMLEIDKKTEGKKGSYKFSIDIIGGNHPLTEDTVNALLNMPRIPEVIYVYSRYMFEASIAFLKQTDERFGIRTMEDSEIKDLIDKVKMLIPASDTSHFTIAGGSGGDEQEPRTAQSLLDAWMLLDEQHLGDQSEEGQDLRVEIKEYIESFNLDIRVSRNKSNYDLIKEIFEAEGKSFEETTQESEESQTSASTLDEEVYNGGARVARPARPRR